MAKNARDVDQLPLGRIKIPHDQVKRGFNRDGMTVPSYLAAISGNSNQLELLYIWDQATIEAKVIIFCLLIFSIVAWSVMITKALQMRRATKLNLYFGSEFKSQKNVLGMFDRRLQVDGCPLFMVYKVGSMELDTRLKNITGDGRKKFVSLKGMEHVKRSLENTVAQESLKLESGLILLAIAVSGAPFLGLLGTVWGVMSTFGHIAQQGSATMSAMAPGVSAALITTVAGLLVAIPSMFGYNWLVHNLRVLTVELDNFAQELVSKMETEYLEDT
ncbi:MAG: MotA/TolQ/ExbB proton channel [Pedosphaera sp.]|nr:MotA/TolQ/ExbB proton channel [Pedosphaera sp.]